MKYLVFALVLLVTGHLWAEIESRAEVLLKRMTLEEKLQQLNMSFAFDTNAVPAATKAARGGLGSIIWGYCDPVSRNAIQRAAVEESRLGIPVLFCNDVIHGNFFTFPGSLGLACAFEPELFERCQAYAGREAKAEGVDLAFAPMCDLARDARWGRVSETCGEDPYLSALCCAAQVRGFQKHVAACAKHYCGYSAVTGGRDYNDSEVTPWTLQNMHLPAFRAAVDAGVLSVMSGFNTWDGVPVTCSRYLLTDVLRGQLGFKGFVTADWAAVGQIVNWGCAADDVQATALALAAGNDVDMCSSAYVKGGKAALADGRLDLATVDAAVLRVLRVKEALGLFERPYCEPAAVDGVRAAVAREAQDLAREAAAKSVVMLKNDGALPLRPTVRKVALVGPLADDRREMIGSWCGRGVATRETLAAALRRELPKGTELAVVPGCQTRLEPPKKTLQDGTVVYDSSQPDGDFQLDIPGAVAAAKAADVVVLAVGEAQFMTGENAARMDLGLTGNQPELVRAVLAAGKPVVAVVCSGRPLALPEIWNGAAAVLYAWQPGREGPAALAELLTGKTGPSGRLSMSVPRSAAESPSFYNAPRTGRPGSGQYRDVNEHGAKYPFGYGFTYSTFHYGKVRIEGDEAVCTVKNVGACAATETTQLYVSQKACAAGARPERELRGFRRVTLAPGEQTDVRFKLTDEVLGYRDRGGAWHCDAGDYEIRIAKDAASGEFVNYARR